MSKYIIKFNDPEINNLRKVGGKNSSLGLMINNLTALGINVPLGFAITTDAYWEFIEHNKLQEVIINQLDKLKINFDITALQDVSKKIIEKIQQGKFPKNIESEIIDAYNNLSNFYQQKDLIVAVRSSATAEDLPTASFAGQQETYLNISEEKNVLKAAIDCISSLFTARAITYRIEKKIDHFKVALSVGIQKMVRSDLASAGVIFTLDTESGFKNIIEITSSYGLGENIVSGKVNPDEFHIFKETLDSSYDPIINKKLGSKLNKLVLGKHKNETVEVQVAQIDSNKFSLNNGEILQLANQAATIETFYTKLNDKWTPMDIEWAKDGIDNKLYIVQARPETVFAHAATNIIKNYYLLNNKKIAPLIVGNSIGNKIASGKVKILNNINEHEKFNSGDILVTKMTDPDWLPLMQKASAIITDNGGRTCHAAIVSREFGIPALIGTFDATAILKDNQEITVDLSKGHQGYVYNGIIDFEVKEIVIDQLPKADVDLYINLSDPNQAFRLSFFPVYGVGLARLEFIITNLIKIHPQAIINFQNLDKNLQNEILKISAGYSTPREFYIQTMAQSIATIASAFYNRPIILRLADFKSNEYKNLLGGDLFEPTEENPTIGFRGAVRYCSDKFKQAFRLDCEAIKIARNIMGFKNIKIIIPFVRTVYDAECALQELKNNGLISGIDNLEILMMCEIPANIIAMDKFSNLFNSFSIGSNDLTQLTLGADRDSVELVDLFDERDIAVKRLIEMAINTAKEKNLYLSICGQAPSDFPDFGDFLIKKGINGISLNPDSVFEFLMRHNK